MTERDGGNGRRVVDEREAEERATIAERVELEHEREADLAAEDRREEETVARRAPPIPEIPTGVILENEDTLRLAAEVMQRLAQLFADERSKLEGQWSRGDNVSTEDLRIALRRYKSFFDRLLTL